MIVHETKRLLLESWNLDHFEPFAELARDPVVMRYISDGSTWPDSKIGWFLGLQHAYQQTLGYSFWKMTLHESGELVGLCGLSPNPALGETELGWWLKPSHWHRGFASEAARHAYEMAFYRHGLTRLIARAYDTNTASVRIIQDLGMTHERTLETNAIGSVLMFGAVPPQD